MWDSLRMSSASGEPLVPSPWDRMFQIVDFQIQTVDIYFTGLPCEMNLKASLEIVSVSGFCVRNNQLGLWLLLRPSLYIALGVLRLGYRLAWPQTHRRYTVPASECWD